MSERDRQDELDARLSADSPFTELSAEMNRAHPRQTDDPGLLEGAARWATENLLESENLTSDLPDAQARRLITWGATQARRLAEGDPRLLEKRVTALRKLMRAVSKFAADGRPVSDERLQQRVRRLDEMARAANISRADDQAVSVALDGWRRMAVADRLNRLLGLYMAGQNG